MRAYLTTLGCRLNEAEVESWAARLQSRGVQVVDVPEKADLMVLNTCAVTAEASRKSRQLARRLQRQNPRARTVLSGCHATLHREETAALEGVDLVVENQDKDNLVELALREFDDLEDPRTVTERGELALFRRGRERAFVKVQDGCRYRCTFCVVTLARGAERSRNVGDIVAEINALVSCGVNEVVLTGVHLGGYGADLGPALPELVATILADTDLPRLRFGSLEPWDLPPSFLALFGDSRMMPHLHLPLQSGSDGVLRRMARRCKTGQYRTLVAQARAAIADLNVTTDVIAGFPGETEREWAETMDFVEEMEFGHLHVFPYSPRSNTKAAAMSGQIGQAVKRERVRALQRLGQQLKRRYLRRLTGRCFPVLWESRETGADGESRCFGYTPNFCRVCVEGPVSADLGNSIRRAHMGELAAAANYLNAELDRGTAV